jgi:hypothetical protein
MTAPPRLSPLVPWILDHDESRLALFDLDRNRPLPRSFVRDLERIAPRRNVFDGESAAFVGHGVERMRVDPEDRLHPPVDVAPHDVGDGLSEEPHHALDPADSRGASFFREIGSAAREGVQQSHHPRPLLHDEELHSYRL